MSVPKIIHQTWKTSSIPRKWKNFQAGVRAIYPDWEYILWTDNSMVAFVKEKFPEFYPTWSGFPKMILKADTFRYLLMYAMGGMYLDLDYEMLRPYDFSGCQILLPQERSLSYGDKSNDIGNCILASVPDHPFWREVIDHIHENPPNIESYMDVVGATGPGLLTKIYNRSHDKYPDIQTPSRIHFHSLPPHSRKDYKALVDNQAVFGIHHGWGSWKERFTLIYMQRKLNKIKKSLKRQLQR